MIRLKNRTHFQQSFLCKGTINDKGFSIKKKKNLTPKITKTIKLKTIKQLSEHNKFYLLIFATAVTDECPNFRN